MRIAVVTMTCGRLPVTRRWLPTLAEHATVPYRHVVVDNGSTDGTVGWLLDAGYDVVANAENVGVTAGWIQGWRRAIVLDGATPDVVVKFDDDCEVSDRGVLSGLVDVAAAGYIAAPRNETILSGWTPRQVGARRSVAGHRVTPVRHVGGLMLAVPADAFAAFVEAGGVARDAARGPWWRRRGWEPVYVDDLSVGHHGRGTSGDRTYVY